MVILETKNGEEQCPDCGNWYSRIASHWSQSDCQWPDIDEYQMELLKGMMLGDGSLHQYQNDAGNPYIRFQMTNKTFLQWLSNELGWLCDDVKMQKTATEMSERVCEGLNNDVSKPEDCLDYYRCRTRSHPLCNQFADWYATGEKVFPQDLKLTPTSLKMWYVSDGSISWRSDDSAQIVFTSRNEAERPGAIISMLEGCDFDVQHSDGGYRFRIPHRQIAWFFDYIGSPPPGFDYKWQYRDRDQYEMFKRKTREYHCTQTLA